MQSLDSIPDVSCRIRHFKLLDSQTKNHDSKLKVCQWALMNSGPSSERSDLLKVSVNRSDLAIGKMINRDICDQKVRFDVDTSGIF